MKKVCSRIGWVLKVGVFLVLSGCSADQWGEAISFIDPVYDQHGVQAGQSMPGRLVVYDLSGRQLFLEDLWQEKPLVLVAGAYTCPVARETLPRLSPSLDRYRPDVRVAVIYVFEPHPSVDPSPYTGREWVSLSNRMEGIVYRQPRTLSQRMELARKLNDRLGEGVEMYVDGMDNSVWKSLGGGPNSSVLISKGMVIAKMGWHHNARMEKMVGLMLTAPRSAHEPKYADE